MIPANGADPHARGGLALAFVAGRLFTSPFALLVARFRFPFVRGEENGPVG